MSVTHTHTHTHTYIYIYIYIYIHIHILFVFFSIMVYLEKAMATHPSTLAWRIPWAEESGRLQSMESDTTERLHFHFSLSCIGEGNGNPLQCSCLENPSDGGGACWAAVYGVAQSRTRLKRLSSSSSSMVYHRILNIVLCAVQWELLVYPLYIYIKFYIC